MDIAKIGTYFDDSINYRSKGDIANYSISEDGVIVNFNMNPYEENILKRPNFISMVLGFVDGLDLGNITEICFAIHPDDIVEDEGMFIIGNVQID